MPQPWRRKDLHARVLCVPVALLRKVLGVGEAMLKQRGELLAAYFQELVDGLVVDAAAALREIVVLARVA